MQGELQRLLAVLCALERQYAGARARIFWTLQSPSLLSNSIVATETILLLDNGVYSDNVSLHGSSRARIIQLDVETKTAHEIKEFAAPDGCWPRCQGTCRCYLARTFLSTGTRPEQPLRATREG